MQKVITAAIAAGLVFTSSARAQDAQTSGDLKCIAVIAFAASQETDAAGVMGAGMGILYFMGRIEGRNPGFDIENGLRIELNRLSSSGLRNELIRCGEVLKSKGEELKAIGRSLQNTPDLKPDT